MFEIRRAEMGFTTTERVTMGVPAAEAVRDQAARMGARRVSLLVGSTLREKTDEIGRIEAALGARRVRGEDRPHRHRRRRLGHRRRQDRRAPSQA